MVELCEERVLHPEAVASARAAMDTRRTRWWSKISRRGASYEFD